MYLLCGDLQQLHKLIRPVIQFDFTLSPRLDLRHGSPRTLLHPLLKDTDDCKNSIIYNVFQVFIRSSHFKCSWSNAARKLRGPQYMYSLAAFTSRPLMLPVFSKVRTLSATTTYIFSYTWRHCRQIRLQLCSFVLCHVIRSSKMLYHTRNSLTLHTVISSGISFGDCKP